MRKRPGKPGRFLLPSPLVGEGGANERSEFGTGEGSVSAERDPSPAFASLRHPLPQGEREESPSLGLFQPLDLGHWLGRLNLRSRLGLDDRGR
jgi:hypothetical protein